MGKNKRKKQVTLAMVADHSQVSKSAVSKVLLGGGGKTTKVSEKTAIRIRESARNLGYCPNWSARSLKTGKTNNIGLLWSLSYPHYSTGIVRDFSIQLMRRGYSTIIVDSLSNQNIIKKALSEFISRKVDGLVFQANDNVLKNQEIREMLGKIENVVMVANHKAVPSFPCVIVDFEDALKRITTLAEKCGRRKMTALVSEAELYYAEILRKYAGSVEIEVSNKYLKDYKNPKEFAEFVLKKYPDTDLYFALSDLTAQAITAGVTENGRRVPGDTGVIGFNNNPFCEVCLPPLASVKIDIEGIINRTLKIIFQNINTEMPEMRNEYVKAEFINRESSGLKDDGIFASGIEE